MMHLATGLGAVACAAMMAFMSVPMVFGVIRSRLRRRTGGPAPDVQVPAPEPATRHRQQAGALR
jgi:hypothetical protein